MQVVAHPGARIEIPNRRRDPPLEGVGDGDREMAVDKLAILVGDIVEAHFLIDLGNRLGVLTPQVRENPPDGNAALLAVQWSLKIHIPLDLLKIG